MLLLSSARCRTLHLLLFVGRNIAVPRASTGLAFGLKKNNNTYFFSLKPTVSMSELMNASSESFAVTCDKDFCEVFQLVALCTSTSGHYRLNA